MNKHARAAWEFILALVTRFREERATQTSGSLTYTTLLSLVPFFTVALAITTAFPVFDEWIGSLQLFVLENVLPDTPAVNTIIDQINSFTANAARLTAIGILGFLVTSVMLMLTVDNALNRIFRVQRRRTILQNIYIYWAVITLGPLLIGASLSATYLAVRESTGALQLDMVRDTLLGIVPFLLTCVTLTLLYGVVPARSVEWRHALTGGILAGGAFAMAKPGVAIHLSPGPT